jgi:hypothetical protein
MDKLMQGFPPVPAGQVTLANWRQAPYNRWGFQHVREIVPSADIPCDPDRLWRLPPAAQSFTGLVIDDGRGGTLDLDGFLAATDTDAIVIVHRGRIVLERYFNGMKAATPHILMSVSKSMLGLLAGILVGRGQLDLDRPAEYYVPESGRTAFAGATIRHLLDMRSGLHFDEDYHATAGPIVEYRKATNWNPPGAGETPSDTRSFLLSLTERARAHGGTFAYISPCTDLLGWIIERTTGVRYADLMSELIWAPLGAAWSAYITVDRLGAPRAAGGMCVTATDLARVGQLLVEGGTRSSRQIVPEAWIDDVVAGGDPAAWVGGNLETYYPGMPIHYRSKFYVERGPSPLIFCLGVHGQNLFVDRKRAIVVAKLSSQALPLDAARIALTGRAVHAIIKALS